MSSYRARMRFGAWGESPAYDDFRVAVLLDAMTRIAEEAYRRFPGMRSIYDGKAAYSFEPPHPGADDEWRDLAALVEVGRASCKSLAAIRAGELRAREGIEARVTWKKTHRNGQPHYHMLVELPDGSIEDPSRALGMK